MRFVKLVGALSVFGLGLSAFTLTSLPAVADTTDRTVQAAEESDDSGVSDRKRIREERRQSREAARAAAIESSDSSAANSGRFIVAVEPEMTCERRVVSGSRVPKEVCRPVGQEGTDQQAAQEFLHRVSELSTVVVPGSSPAIPGLPAGP